MTNTSSRRSCCACHFAMRQSYYAACMAQELPQRTCQSCTACCEGHLQLSKNLTSGSEHESCVHCTQAGCNIYANRPQEPCRTFECLWLTANSPLPDWMRPDESRVIVTINRFKWNHHPVVVGLQLDPDIPDRTLRYLREWTRLAQLPLTLIDSPVNSAWISHDG